MTRAATACDDEGVETASQGARICARKRLQGPGASAALPAADTRWIERTLASLSLRQKVAQLIMPWVGGDYAAVGSPEFEQVRRWVEDDEVGGKLGSVGEGHGSLADARHAHP